jgi:alginate O-acetyltransferase complex protein AlgJ
MKPTTHQQSREEMAWVEVGHTEIKVAASWILALVFLGLVYGVPLHQLFREWQDARANRESFRPLAAEIFAHTADALVPLRENGLRLSSIIAANRIMLRHLNDYEDRLEDEWRIGQRIRPLMQEQMTRWLGMGNEQAYVGRAGWLFFRPDVDYLTGPDFLDPRRLTRRAASGSEWVAPPQPDPRVAIIAFHRQLAARGIHLIVLPVPVKTSIHPDRFSARFEPRVSAWQNGSYYEPFLDALAREGVTVFDPAPLLGEKNTSDAPAYLATDTHWRPEAMGRVAQQLAERIAAQKDISASITSAWKREAVEHRGAGDIALMLDLPKNQTLFPLEAVNLSVILSPDGQYWRSSPDAEILLLGDSFSNIYSMEPMGWGESAGLAEQLSFFLQRPVDRLVRNDAGAFATRDMLSRELARGRDRLAGKKVVIWQFAARELAAGDWRMIPMDVREAPPATFIVPAPGETRLVRGTVREVSPVPRPGTVPYRDHVISVHLVDIDDAGEAVVYLKSMSDNEWTRAARLRPGEEISVRVQAWSEVAARYDGINRSELSDLELQLQEPCWGELAADNP